MAQTRNNARFPTITARKASSLFSRISWQIVKTALSTRRCYTLSVPHPTEKRPTIVPTWPYNRDPVEWPAGRTQARSVSVIPTTCQLVYSTRPLLTTHRGPTIRSAAGARGIIATDAPVRLQRRVGQRDRRWRDYRAGHTRRTCARIASSFCRRLFGRPRSARIALTAAPSSPSHSDPVVNAVLCTVARREAAAPKPPASSSFRTSLTNRSRSSGLSNSTSIQSVQRVWAISRRSLRRRLHALVSLVIMTKCPNPKQSHRASRQIVSHLMSA
jgi:hypothetical protein